MYTEYFWHSVHTHSLSASRRLANVNNSVPPLLDLKACYGEAAPLHTMTLDLARFM
jgi:hypothetical protein